MNTKLAEVKRALAEKYVRLSKAARSKVRRRKYLNKAASYKQQAEEATRD